MLLPFELILTVGAAAAVFVLGIMVWKRNTSATGNLLYSLIAFSLATWTSADWMLNLQSTALPEQVFIWKLLFYLSVCMGPALTISASAYLTHRTFHRAGIFLYIAGIVAWFCLVFGLTAPFVEVAEMMKTFLTGGAVLTLSLYIVAFFFLGISLFPVTIAKTSGLLNRRRAIYGLLLLTPYLIAGGMQMIVGPIPTGYFLPLLAICFLVISLLAFIRASFLDVKLNALEAFFLFLTAFAIVLLLRSRSIAEAISLACGSAAVGAFAWLAIRTVRVERHKRVLLEETNRQLRMLERAQNDFVDMVAHQLRSPIGGIRAATSMLAAGDYGVLPKQARDAARLIQDSATRLLSLADTFLNASRIEMGKYESRRVSTNVAREIQQLIAELSLLAASKGIALRTKWRASFPSMLIVDQEALVNAVFNLLDNAVKYTERGVVEIFCHLEPNVLVVSVKDTGVGMLPSEIAELFKKFHRGKRGRLHEQDGTGLGLYVVKELVEAAGGKITAASDGPGTGSIFTFRLPCEQ